MRSVFIMSFHLYTEYLYGVANQGYDNDKTTASVFFLHSKLPLTFFFKLNNWQGHMHKDFYFCLFLPKKSDL